MIQMHRNMLEYVRYTNSLSIYMFLISNSRRVLYVACFLLGNSPAPEFYMPTFRNTLFHLYLPINMDQT